MNKFFIVQTEDAKDLPLPGYMSAQAAGMDLYANIHEDLTIYPKDIVLVPTGIKIALPDGYEAQIRPRSGLALKHGITMANAPGTIDADYRGEIQVILIHLGQAPFTIHRKDRIAQMVVHRYTKVEWQPLEQLPDTDRGEGGFGHSGI